MTRRKVLVTGGAGFIGSHVAEAHVRRGDRVWIADNLSSGKRANVPAGAELIVMDIADAALDDLLRGIDGVDLISHHAAQIDVRVSVTQPRRDAATNIDGFLNVVECGRRHGVRRVLYVSSGGVVYGEPERRPTPEGMPKLPRSPYGVSKLSGEHYLYYYANEHGLEYAALRYSNVYGPRQDPHGEAGVVAIFSQRLLAGEPLTIFGDGAQTRDYVYVADVVAANLLLADAPLEPPRTLDARAYNVGTGVETSVVELAAALIEVSGRSVERRHAAARAGELQHSCLDAARLRGLGWRPSVTLHEGLSHTFNYIASQEGAA
ncbi:MAG TPA: NAD-dependent epimerase/dehydratase family protein [Longimicrobiales bacterium]|nr:NAD-dependent epimerase/dehydratase family protein [Longimicrobiales bacterium]